MGLISRVSSRTYRFQKMSISIESLFNETISEIDKYKLDENDKTQKLIKIENEPVKKPKLSTCVIFNNFKYYPDYRNKTGKTHYICHICFYEILNDKIKYFNHISKCQNRHKNNFLAEYKKAKLV